MFAFQNTTLYPPPTTALCYHREMLFNPVNPSNTACLPAFIPLQRNISADFTISYQVFVRRQDQFWRFLLSFIRSLKKLKPILLIINNTPLILLTLSCLTFK